MTYIGKPAQGCCVTTLATPILHTDVGLANLHLAAPVAQRKSHLGPPGNLVFDDAV